MEEIVKSGLVNYYGEVECIKNGGKYFMRLEDWDGYKEIGVSKEFYEAFKQEFKKKGENSHV